MPLHEIDDFFFGNKLAVNFDALPKVTVVRRGVETSLPSLSSEYGGEEMGDGAFPVGAGDVDGGKFLFRMTQTLAESDGVGQVFFEGRRPNPVEHGQLGKEVV